MAHKKSRRCLPAQAEGKVTILTRDLSTLQVANRLRKGNQHNLFQVLQQHLIPVRAFMNGDTRVSCDTARAALLKVEQLVASNVTETD